MKKSIYIAVLTVVTVICIIVGVVKHTMHNFSEVMHFTTYSAKDLTSKESGETITGTEQLDAFTNIDADMNVMNLYIKTGDNYALDYDCDKIIEPTWKVENGTLYLTQKGGKIKLSNHVHYKMTLYVPQTAVLDHVKVNVDAGNLNMTEISGTVFDGEVDAGNVELHECVFDTFGCEVDAGNLQLSNCQTTDFTAQLDMGNIEHKKGTFTTVDVKADLGNVTLDSKNCLDDYAMDIKVDMGNFDINGAKQKNSFEKSGKSGKIKAEASLGNISIKD